MARRSPAFNDKAIRSMFEGRPSGPAIGAPVLEAATHGSGAGVTYGPGSDTPFDDAMTRGGALTKTSLLVGLLLFAAIIPWTMVNSGSPLGGPVMIGGLIGGLVVGLITAFKPKLAPYTAPLYAVLEGLFLGGISAVYEAAFEGIVLQAVLATIGTTLVMLQLYRTGTIKVTDKFRSVVLSATFGIMAIYVLSFVLRLFGVELPFLHSSGPLGILISVGITVVAALNLLLDFDFIDRAVAARAPKAMEWYAGFGILVTLVWLYLEILRLISKLRD